MRSSSAVSSTSSRTSAGKVASTVARSISAAPAGAMAAAPAAAPPCTVSRHCQPCGRQQQQAVSSSTKGCRSSLLCWQLLPFAALPCMFSIPLQHLTARQSGPVSCNVTSPAASGSLSGCHGPAGPICQCTPLARRWQACLLCPPSTYISCVSQQVLQGVTCCSPVEQLPAAAGAHEHAHAADARGAAGQ